jgi:hypothetical protein
LRTRKKRRSSCTQQPPATCAFNLDIASIRFFIASSKAPRFSQHGSQATLFPLHINEHVACRDIELSCAGMSKTPLFEHDRGHFDQGKYS